MLSSVKPEILLLSETHWNKSFNIQFHTFHTLKKDYEAIMLNTDDTIEAIGVKIKCTNNDNITFTSVYAPKGDCSSDDIGPLLNYPNAFVTCGDIVQWPSSLMGELN
jgi:hypothetical protein